MRNIISLSIKCFSALILVSCTMENPSDVSGGDDKNDELKTTTKAQEQIKGGLTDFSFDIFREVTRNNVGKSFMISPLSLSMALAMTEGGAAGATATEMKTVLGFADGSQDDFAAYFNDLSKILQDTDADVEVNIANAIWSDLSFPVLDSFKSFSHRWYGATVETRDFSKEATATEINRWCSDHTNGKIPEITDSQTLNNLCLCLINALYFNGKWQKEARRTYDGVFTCYDGKQVDAQMMLMGTESNLYASVDDLAFVEIPYGNGTYVFDIIFPDKGNDIYGAIKTLSGKVFDNLVSKAVNTEMVLTIPKFKIEFTTDEFIDNLKTLGMVKAFSSEADFSNLSEVPSCIDLIVQKTYIDVSEKGTEAAAVTEIGLKETCVGDPAKVITVDRPFVFAIRETSTNTVLFAGTKVSF